MVEIALFTTSLGDPAVDTAVADELARRVSDGRSGPVARVCRLPPTLAFGRADRNAPRYRDAVAAAVAAGFAPVERLAGGRAAVFHEGTLAVSVALPIPDPRTGITERFSLVAGLTRVALRGLGADAHIGQIPGEYCPGAYSIHLGGRVKVAGYGQRIYPASAHVGGVVVVEGAHRIREVLVPVYDALELEWDPATAGAVADEVSVDLDTVAGAIVDALGAHFTVVPTDLDADVVAAAEARADTLRPH